MLHDGQLGQLGIMIQRFKRSRSGSFHLGAFYTNIQRPHFDPGMKRPGRAMSKTFFLLLRYSVTFYLRIATPKHLAGGHPSFLNAQLRTRS